MAHSRFAAAVAHEWSHLLRLQYRVDEPAGAPRAPPAPRDGPAADSLIRRVFEAAAATATGDEVDDRGAAELRRVAAIAERGALPPMRPLLAAWHLHPARLLAHPTLLPTLLSLLLDEGAATAAAPARIHAVTAELVAVLTACTEAVRACEDPTTVPPHVLLRHLTVAAVHLPTPAAAASTSASFAPLPRLVLAPHHFALFTAAAAISVMATLLAPTDESSGGGGGDGDGGNDAAAAAACVAVLHAAGETLHACGLMQDAPPLDAPEPLPLPPATVYGMQRLMEAALDLAPRAVAALASPPSTLSSTLYHETWRGLARDCTPQPQPLAAMVMRAAMRVVAGVAGCAFARQRAHVAAVQHMPPVDAAAACDGDSVTYPLWSTSADVPTALQRLGASASAISEVAAPTEGVPPASAVSTLGARLLPRDAMHRCLLSAALGVILVPAEVLDATAAVLPLLTDTLHHSDSEGASGSPAASILALLEAAHHPAAAHHRRAREVAHAVSSCERMLCPADADSDEAPEGWPDIATRLVAADGTDIASAVDVIASAFGVAPLPGALAAAGLPRLVCALVVHVLTLGIASDAEPQSSCDVLLHLLQHPHVAVRLTAWRAVADVLRQAMQAVRHFGFDGAPGHAPTPQLRNVDPSAAVALLTAAADVTVTDEERIVREIAMAAGGDLASLAVHHLLQPATATVQSHSRTIASAVAVQLTRAILQLDAAAAAMPSSAAAAAAAHHTMRGLVRRLRDATASGSGGGEDIVPHVSDAIALSLLRDAYHESAPRRCMATAGLYLLLLQDEVPPAAAGADGAPLLVLPPTPPAQLDAVAVSLAGSVPPNPLLLAVGGAVMVAAAPVSSTGSGASGDGATATPVLPPPCSLRRDFSEVDEALNMTVLDEDAAPAGDCSEAVTEHDGDSIASERAAIAERRPSRPDDDTTAGIDASAVAAAVALLESEREPLPLRARTAVQLAAALCDGGTEEEVAAPMLHHRRGAGLSAAHWAADCAVRLLTATLQQLSAPESHATAEADACDVSGAPRPGMARACAAMLPCSLWQLLHAACHLLHAAVEMSPTWRQHVCDGGLGGPLGAIVRVWLAVCVADMPTPAENEAGTATATSATAASPRLLLARVVARIAFHQAGGDGQLRLPLPSAASGAGWGDGTWTAGGRSDMPRRCRLAVSATEWNTWGMLRHAAIASAAPAAEIQPAIVTSAAAVALLRRSGLPPWVAATASAWLQPPLVPSQHAADDGDAADAQPALHLALLLAPGGSSGARLARWVVGMRPSVAACEAATAELLHGIAAPEGWRDVDAACDRVGTATDAVVAVCAARGFTEAAVPTLARLLVALARLATDAVATTGRGSSGAVALASAAAAAFWRVAGACVSADSSDEGRRCGAMLLSHPLATQIVAPASSPAAAAAATLPRIAAAHAAALAAVTTVVESHGFAMLADACTMGDASGGRWLALAGAAMAAATAFARDCIASAVTPPARLLAAIIGCSTALAPVAHTAAVLGAPLAADLAVACALAPLPAVVEHPSDAMLVTAASCRAGRRLLTALVSGSAAMVRGEVVVAAEWATAQLQHWEAKRTVALAPPSVLCAVVGLALPLGVAAAANAAGADSGSTTHDGDEPLARLHATALQMLALLVVGDGGVGMRRIRGPIAVAVAGACLTALATTMPSCGSGDDGEGAVAGSSDDDGQTSLPRIVAALATDTSLLAHAPFAAALLRCLTAMAQLPSVGARTAAPRCFATVMGAALRLAPPPADPAALPAAALWDSPHLWQLARRFVTAGGDGGAAGLTTEAAMSAGWAAFATAAAQGLQSAVTACSTARVCAVVEMVLAIVRSPAAIAVIAPARGLPLDRGSQALLQCLLPVAASPLGRLPVVSAAPAAIPPPPPPPAPLAAAEPYGIVLVPTGISSIDAASTASLRDCSSLAGDAAGSAAAVAPGARPAAMRATSAAGAGLAWRSHASGSDTAGTSTTLPPAAAAVASGDAMGGVRWCDVALPSASPSDAMDATAALLRKSAAACLVALVQAFAAEDAGRCSPASLQASQLIIAPPCAPPETLDVTRALQSLVASCSTGRPLHPHQRSEMAALAAVITAAARVLGADGRALALPAIASRLPMLASVCVALVDVLAPTAVAIHPEDAHRRLIESSWAAATSAVAAVAEAWRGAMPITSLPRDAWWRAFGGGKPEGSRSMAASTTTVHSPAVARARAGEAATAIVPLWQRLVTAACQSLQAADGRPAGASLPALRALKCVGAAVSVDERIAVAVLSNGVVLQHAAWCTARLQLHMEHGGGGSGTARLQLHMEHGGGGSGTVKAHGRRAAPVSPSLVDATAPLLALLRAGAHALVAPASGSTVRRETAHTWLSLCCEALRVPDALAPAGCSLRTAAGASLHALAIADATHPMWATHGETMAALTAAHVEGRSGDSGGGDGALRSAAEAVFRASPRLRATLLAAWGGPATRTSAGGTTRSTASSGAAGARAAAAAAVFVTPTKPLSAGTAASTVSTREKMLAVSSPPVRAAYGATGMAAGAGGGRFR